MTRISYLSAAAARADSFWVTDHLNALVPRSIATPEHIAGTSVIPDVDAFLEPWTLLGNFAARNRLGRPRLEIGSVAAAALGDPLARAMYTRVTADVEVSDTEVADYHARNPLRFARLSPIGNGWRTTTVEAPPLHEARPMIAEHLRGVARRRVFRLWLDARCAELVWLAPGYEHPGDPRQPDNTHRH